MAVSSSIEALVREQLHRAGRISAGQTLTFQPVAQNAERRDYAASKRQVVASGKTGVAFLIAGQNLSELRRRIELFSTAYPGLACPVFAQGHTADEEFLLTEYFDGINAGDALTNPQIGIDGVLAALQTVAGQYSKAIRPSTHAAAREELQGLFSRVLAIEYWTAIDRSFFTSVVFPFVEQRLIPDSPSCRVTNGDLTLTNVMRRARDRLRGRRPHAFLRRRLAAFDLLEGAGRNPPVCPEADNR